MTLSISANSHQARVVAALYKFVRLPDYREMQSSLLDRCKRLQLKGTLLLAEEGINGTIAGSREAIDLFFDYLYRDRRFLNLEYRESIAAELPFQRLKVKLKQEIVTMGVANLDPTRNAATRLNVAEWNRLIADPEVLLLDVRNRYEYGIGSFRNARSADIDSFRQFPQYVTSKLEPARHKPVAMFCTGGIRCEKAGTFMLTRGYERVYQLHGGILRYLDQVPPAENLWRGDCFVFDGRGSVNKNLQQGGYEQCFTAKPAIVQPHRRRRVKSPGCLGAPDMGADSTTAPV